MNPAEAVRRHAEQNGDRVVMVCEDIEQTYGQLYERSQRLANALGGVGLRPGDCVAILLDNGPATLELVVGISFAGLVRAPLYGHDPATRHEYLINLTEATALIIDEKYLEPLEPHLGACPGIRELIVLGDGEFAREVVRRGPARAYEEFVAAASTEPVLADLSPDAPYQIRFSAGTTGNPKGILHSVGGWTAAGNQIAEILDQPLTSDDRYLAAGPLTHAASMPVWPLLDAGGTVVVMPSFDAGRFLELTERHRVTISLVVPAMVQVLTAHPEAPSRDLSSLRAVYYGTSPMPESILVAGIALWGNIMYQVYGQSEALPVAALVPRDHVVDGDELHRGRLRSAGRPLASCEVRIVDDADREVARGEVGEIVVNTPGRMKEIWGDPEATKARITSDGWVRTRDMGRFDEDGFLFLADRKEDMIISGGYNIWPAELENALVDHPAVLEAAVVGVPHSRWGESPHAVVVLDPERAEDVDEAELIAWTRRAVGSVKKVTGVTFADELPRTPIGKVLRRVLREQLARDE